MPGGVKARLTSVVLAVVALLAQEARAQTAPLPEDERRVQSAEEFVTKDAQAKLEETIAAVESERAPRRFFLVVRREPYLAAFAQRTAEEWTKRVQSGAETPFQPETSFVICVFPGTGEVAIECPPEQRDQLGLSPFVVRDELTGPSFAAAAKRNDLARGLEKLVLALSTWLGTADAELARQRLEALDDGDDPSVPVSREPLRPLADRLARLEDRTLELEAKGVELPNVEQHLAAARKSLRALLAVPREHHEASSKRARLLRDEMDAAARSLDEAENERRLVLQHYETVKAAYEHAKTEITPPSVELERAKTSLAAAFQDSMKRPTDAHHHLYDAENAITRARVDATPPPAPSAPPPSTSWKRILLALFVLVVVFGVGLVSVTRATRAEARVAYLARRDEVARDARDFRELLERQRARRDQVARSVPITIPGSLAQELCLTTGTEELSTLATPPAFRGDTERLLMEAGAGLSELGVAWDAGERALEAAHREAKKAGFLSVVPFQKARALLDLVPDRVDLEAAVGTVSVAVDRLTVAPEDARRAVAEMWTLVQRARAALDAAPRSSVSPTAFEDELASMMELVADAAFAAAVDPVRALRACQAVRDAALALEQALERAFATQLEIGLVLDEVARVERTLDPTSPNGQDPRGACERARGSLAEAAAALELGAPDEAERELAQARTHLRLAEEMLARGEEAKKAGGSTLEQRRAEAKEARSALEKAREVLAKLEADHAPPAVADVRPIVDAAVATLPALDSALDDLAKEEAPLASPQAHARLLRLDAHVTEIDRAAHAVDRRRQILDETKTQLKTRADELDRRLRELGDHAKQEDVALRAETLERVKALSDSVARVTGLVRGDAPSPDLLAIARDVDAVEGELEESRLQVSRDAFLCRRVLSARKASEDAIRSADDAIRRGTDRLAARARARRARDLVEKVGEKLTKPDSDWYVVLEAYSSALRAARGARDLGFQKQKDASEGEHAKSAASAAIRRAERWDAPLVRADANEAHGMFQRAASEMETNESAAVDLFEKAAQAADEAVRAALQAVRNQAKAADATLREIAKTHRVAREAMERRRRVHDAKRRAEWIERRFAKAVAEPVKVDAPSA